MGDDPEAIALEPVVDRAGKIAPGRIRLDDRQGTLDGHGGDSLADGGRRVIASGLASGNRLRSRASESV